MSRGLVALVALVAALAVAGCQGSKVTEIVVVIGTDIVVPDEMNRLHLKVYYPPAGAVPGQELSDHLAYDVTWDLGTTSPRPLTIGLLPGQDGRQPVLVTVRGLLEEKDRVQRQAQLLFVPDRVVLLRMNLLHRCMSTKSCELPLTCGEGGCQSIVQDQGKLPRFSEEEAAKPYFDAAGPGDRPGLDQRTDGPRPPDGPKPPDSAKTEGPKSPDLKKDTVLVL